MIYGIDHWKIIWISYRKLAWVGFESTTTEFLSDALIDWAIRPWVQLVLRANFVQPFQFHLLLVSHFILAIAFLSRYVYFNRNFLKVIFRYILKGLVCTCNILSFWGLLFTFLLQDVYENLKIQYLRHFRNPLFWHLVV